jgi:hypothetical protein
MTNLHDQLIDLCTRAIECHDQAYSENKDPDDAEDRLTDLLEVIVAEKEWEITASLKNYLGVK